MAADRPGGRSARPVELAGAAALALLTLAVGLGVARHDRRDWPGFIGDEATYLMAAESLAWDLDYTFDRGDYDRFLANWGERSELLLFLQGGRRSATVAYGKPLYYPLAAAPLTRLAPRHGAPLTNVAFLALAAAVAWRALRPVLGAAAPLWIAVFLFASVSFAYCYWAHADLFLMAMTAIGLGLAFGRYRPGAEGEDNDAAPWRWLAAGAALGVVAFSRPFYAPLLLPAALALPRRRRAASAAALLAGVALVVLPAVAVHFAVAGTWSGYTGLRGGFYAQNGLPGIHFPAAEWRETLMRQGNFAWHQASAPLAQETSAELTAWNLAYFFAGRHVGLVPYFLPALVAAAAWPRGWARWGLWLALAAGCGLFFFYRPFNFFGGGAAIGNRYFLPLFPATWFLAGKRRGWAVPVLTAAAAAPFLWPLWTGAGAYPLDSRRAYRFVSPAARELLAFETTQSHLKPGGQEDVVHHGLWLKPLDPELAAASDLLRAPPGRPVELLVASERALAALELTVPERHDVRLVPRGGRVTDSRILPPGRSFHLELGPPRAVHPMWWSWSSWHLYDLELRLETTGTDSIAFFLEPAAGTDGR